MGMLTSGFVIANAAQPSSASAGTIKPAPIAATEPAYALEWRPSTAYALGQQVVSLNNDVVSAKVAHTSSAAYATDIAKWTLSSSYAPITPTESYSYIPGIVADSGVTDNYAVITAYLATLTNGGQNNLVLPSGYIGVGTPIVPPEGVILNGSGYSVSRSYGTVLCPMQTNTIASSHGVVDLSNNHSGINNLNICGLNHVSYAQANYALNISGAEGNTFTQCGLHLGGLASLHTTTTAGTTTGTTWFAMQGPSSDALAVWLEGNDALYSDFFAGPTKITGGANQLDNFHLISGPDGIETLPLLYDLGANIFTNGYFDSVLTGANAMIDRSAATIPSRYAACLWFQSATAAVTGIPIFLEATAAGAGADIDGFVSYPFGGGASTFTYFIKNPIVSTRARVNVPSGALTSGMSNNSLGSVVNTVHAPGNQTWLRNDTIAASRITTYVEASVNPSLRFYRASGTDGLFDAWALTGTDVRFDFAAGTAAVAPGSETLTSPILSLGGPAKIGFFNTAPIAKRATTADATDLASAIALVNALKADLIAYGLKS